MDHSFSYFFNLIYFSIIYRFLLRNTNLFLFSRALNAIFLDNVVSVIVVHILPVMLVTTQLLVYVCNGVVRNVYVFLEVNITII
jgi:hypothetical protein